MTLVRRTRVTTTMKMHLQRRNKKLVKKTNSVS
jgi:hypothetical protein